MVATLSSCACATCEGCIAVLGRGNCGSRGAHRDGRMAKYGVWMLEKLILQYCGRGGSSAGMRCGVMSHGLHDT